MTEKVENTEEPVQSVSIRKKCAKCIKGPNLIKTLVVFICTGVAVQQITTCVIKLIDRPITTYTHFDFNKSIMYPSVTFCREPPYKYEKMREYGLWSHPMFTSKWSDFNFTTSLDKLWRDITYEPEDYFIQYGLLNEEHNLEIKETIGFMHGRCYTLTPKIEMRTATRESGMSIALQHSPEDMANPTSLRPPGYHAYVHYTREPFTEVAVYNGGLVDYLFVDVGETIDVKLAVNKYIMISDDSEPCIDSDSYSANECTTQFVWDQVASIAGCSGPWMQTDYPYCDNYNSMNDLIVAYLRLYRHHRASSCPRFCTSYLYNAFVNDRHRYAWDSQSHQWVSRMGDAEASLQTQIYIYFNSMMVSVYEERYNYDWNLFVSDLGGSVGFLLGLSVIGLMKIVEKLWSDIIGPRIRAPRAPKDNSQSKDTSTVSENIYQNQVFIDPAKFNSKNYYQTPLPRIPE